MSKIRRYFSHALEPGQPRCFGIPYQFFIMAWVVCLEAAMILGWKAGLAIGPLILIGTVVGTRRADKRRAQVC